MRKLSALSTFWFRRKRFSRNRRAISLLSATCLSVNRYVGSLRSALMAPRVADAKPSDIRGSAFAVAHAFSGRALAVHALHYFQVLPRPQGILPSARFLTHGARI